MTIITLLDKGTLTSGPIVFIILGVILLSLFSTQVFAQFTECAPNEVKDIAGECVVVLDDDSTSDNISVETDASSYNDVDTIIISGQIQNPSDIAKPVALIITDSVGDIIFVIQIMPSSDGSFFHSMTAGDMQSSGDYTLSAQYESQKSTTTFSFVGTTTCGSNEIIVNGECVNAFDAPKLLSSNPRLVDVSGNTINSVFVGQIVQITADIENQNNFVQSFVFDYKVRETEDNGWIMGSINPNQSLSPATSWTPNEEGAYTIDITIFYDLEKQNVLAPTITINQLVDSPPEGDIVPPFILTPFNITVDASDSSGAVVDYSIKTIDDVDGELDAKCTPSSGSLFKIGETFVTCSATDNSGNSDRKSFVVTVSTFTIPDWIKSNAGWWAEGSIDDNSFVQGIQFLIKVGLMEIPTTEQGTVSQNNQIPDWIKSNAGWWADGSIDDDSFVQGIQFLIKEGLMKISN